MLQNAQIHGPKNNDIVNKLGFSHVQTDPVSQVHNYVNHMQIRINDQTLQEQDSFILGSSKLDFYKCIYKIQTRAPYVDLLNCRSDRSTLTKVRFSAHKLNIEKGRYANIPRQNRVCNVCSTASVENEIHFLLECLAYSRERVYFFLKLNKLYNKNYFNSKFKSQNVFIVISFFNIVKM